MKYSVLLFLALFCASGAPALAHPNPVGEYVVAIKNAHSRLQILSVSVRHGVKVIDHNEVGQQLLDLQKLIGSIGIAASRENLARMRAGESDNATLLAVDTEADILGVEIDSLTNYLDTQLVGFAVMADAAERDASYIEIQFY